MFRVPLVWVVPQTVRATQEPQREQGWKPLLRACEKRERWEMAGEQKRHALKPSGGKRNLLAHVGGVLLNQYTELAAAVSFVSLQPLPARTRVYEKPEAAPLLLVGAACCALADLVA